MRSLEMAPTPNENLLELPAYEQSEELGSAPASRKDSQMSTSSVSSTESCDMTESSPQRKDSSDSLSSVSSFSSADSSSKSRKDSNDSLTSVTSMGSVSEPFDELSPLPQVHLKIQRTLSSEGSEGEQMQCTSDNEGSVNKDSGVEVDKDAETEFIPPDEEMTEKIITQVEFYFSDANITKDAFLLKHVRRNKEGFVSLKLISSFKRVKHLTKDWRMVAFALQKSRKLEINEAGTKVRRLEPLPEYDETTPSRTVVAINLPMEKPTIEGVAELFSKCGEISLIRILRPNNPVPNDVKQFINKHPQLGTSICALVEFEKTEYAHNAVRDLDGKDSDWRSMHVVQLVKQVKKDSKSKSTLKGTKENIMDVQSESQKLELQVSDEMGEEQCKKKKRNRRTKTNRIYSLRQEPDSPSVSSSEAECDKSPYTRRRAATVAVLPKDSTFSSNPAYPSYPRRNPKVSPQTQRNTLPPTCESRVQRQKSISLCEHGNNNGPWVQRRLAAAALAAAFSNGPESRWHPISRRENSRNSLSVTENVIRFPRGPDGTAGFARGYRENMKSRSESSHTSVPTEVC